MQAQTGSQSDFNKAKSELAHKLEEGKQTATEALHDARDEVTRKAREYASEAKSTLFEQAEGTKRDISSNMIAFGGALRAASEHLANADQRSASKFALEAAGGLERLSSSLKDKPFEEILSEIRTFGKQNAGALIAGSVLAGLAFGRVLKSSAASTNPAKSDLESGSSAVASETSSPENQTGKEEPNDVWIQETGQ
jgi:hypothetical protein